MSELTIGVTLLNIAIFLILSLLRMIYDDSHKILMMFILHIILCLISVIGFIAYQGINFIILGLK